MPFLLPLQTDGLTEILTSTTLVTKQPIDKSVLDTLDQFKGTQGVGFIDVWWTEDDGGIRTPPTPYPKPTFSKYLHTYLCMYVCEYVLRRYYVCRHVCMYITMYTLWSFWIAFWKLEIRRCWEAITNINAYVSMHYVYVCVSERICVCVCVYLVKIFYIHTYTHTYISLL